MNGKQAIEPILTRLRQTTAQHELAQRAFDRLIPVLLIVFVLSAAHAHPQPGLDGRRLVVTVAGIVFLFSAITARWALGRSRVGLHLGVVVLIVSSLALMWEQPGGPGGVALFLIVLFRARGLSAHIAIAISGLAFALLEAIALIRSGNAVSPVLLAALGGFYAMTFLAVRLGEANRQAAQFVLELEHRQAAEARAAALAERQRLAREGVTLSV